MKPFAFYIFYFRSAILYSIDISLVSLYIIQSLSSCLGDFIRFASLYGGRKFYLSSVDFAGCLGLVPYFLVALPAFVCFPVIGAELLTFVISLDFSFGF